MHAKSSAHPNVVQFIDSFHLKEVFCYCCLFFSFLFFKRKRKLAKWVLGGDGVYRRLHTRSIARFGKNCLFLVDAILLKIKNLKNRLALKNHWLRNDFGCYFFLTQNEIDGICNSWSHESIGNKLKNYYCFSFPLVWLNIVDRCLCITCNAYIAISNSATFLYAFFYFYFWIFFEFFEF